MAAKRLSHNTEMRPIVIASANGHQFRNGGSETCVERAFGMITGRPGADLVESLVAGVTIVELDPDETSVGVGALPNADGFVELDACCIDGASRRAGAVAALRGVSTAAAVAQRVMTATPHHMIAGEGAREFARVQGFDIDQDLWSPRSHALWQEWRRRVDERAGSAPAADRWSAGYDVGAEMEREGLIDRNHRWGTLNCSGLDAAGHIASVTTTSGRAWKIPGRVGDSPVIGAGLYARRFAGAAGSTGRGESNLLALSSYAIVADMGRGMHPLDAAMAALRQVRADAVDPALLNERGEPNFNVKFYAIAADRSVRRCFDGRCRRRALRRMH